MLNEFLKGGLNKLWRVPAFKRSFGESKNLIKLVHCRCWPLGCAQCFYLWIPWIPHIISLSGLKHWTKSKVVNLMSDPNLFKCIMDPEVMSMLNPTKEGFGAAQYAKYSVFNFLKHPDLDSFKRTGKVSFVQCKKWLVFHEPLVQWSRSVVNINKWSDNGTLRLLFNALKLRKLWKHCQNDYKSIIISYQSMRNFQLNPKLKSKFGFMLKKAKIDFKILRSGFLCLVFNFKVDLPTQNRMGGSGTQFFDFVWLFGHALAYEPVNINFRRPLTNPRFYFNRVPWVLHYSYLHPTINSYKKEHFHFRRRIFSS